MGWLLYLLLLYPNGLTEYRFIKPFPTYAACVKAGNDATTILESIGATIVVADCKELYREANNK